MAKNIEITYETILKAFERVGSNLQPGSISWAMEMADQLNNPPHVCEVCHGDGRIHVSGVFVKCSPCNGVGRFETAEASEKAKLSYFIFKAH